MLQQQLTSCLEESWITESSFVVVPEKGTSSAPTLTEVAMPSGRLDGRNMVDPVLGLVVADGSSSTLQWLHARERREAGLIFQDKDNQGANETKCTEKNSMNSRCKCLR